MKKYGVNELRKMFLDFFESKDHLVHSSYSLVPQNDKSLLLINAGMAPLKPYFTGLEVPPKKRMATCQKCIRTGDIDNVGKTARHGTFFEMLGNFSFGDYFKKEAIMWSWEFLTEVVGLDPDRLYPSVYEEDDEAFELWRDMMHIPENRIFKFGKEDNFWEHGAGPCGPCSEIYYDRGEEYGCGKPGCTVGCDCDRYIEIWNNVFTQFEGDGHGNYETLETKNIDTGMGLERLAVVVQDVPSIFDVDTVKSLLNHVCKLAQVEYTGKTTDSDISIRVITDHTRAITFMASDGIFPSNEGRGYVFRRLLRRACRHGRLLGIKDKFLLPLVQTVIDGSKDGYPELDEKKDFIFKIIENEEEQFNKTLDQGLAILKEYVEDLKDNNLDTLDGKLAFKLHDTYGFPLDLSIEILAEQGIKVDIDGFNQAMQIQKDTARGARQETNYMGADSNVYETISDTIPATEFIGYNSNMCSSDVLCLIKDNEDSSEIVSQLSAEFNGELITSTTPFYATMGGQLCDNGIISNDNFEFVVSDVKKVNGDRYVHIGKVTKGQVSVGDDVTLKIDENRRNLTRANHTATHLLQKALKEVLGNHVEQAGSYVDKDYLRFDFSHFEPMTNDQITEVEKIVNSKILEAINVSTEVMPIEEARKTGANALFGEKYGDEVRVVSVGDFSLEFCGGTHVNNTSDIGAFKILSESGVAAGTRRIEAKTSFGLIKYLESKANLLDSISNMLKTNSDNLSEKISKVIEENKSLNKELKKLKSDNSSINLDDITSKAIKVNDSNVLVSSIDNMDMNSLRTLGDKLKDKLGNAYIVLASSIDSKVNLVATCTKDINDKGGNAGNLIKEIAPLVGGGGGGRPNMAQAGGKDASGIDQALAKSIELIKSQIS